MFVSPFPKNQTEKFFVIEFLSPRRRQPFTPSPLPPISFRSSAPWINRWHHPRNEYYWTMRGIESFHPRFIFFNLLLFSPIEINEINFSSPSVRFLSFDFLTWKYLPFKSNNLDERRRKWVFRRRSRVTNISLSLPPP